MNPKRRKRLVWLSSMVMGVGMAVSFVLYALNKNINLYYTPTQISTSQLPLKHLRLGGLVKKGSLKREPNTLNLAFVITDFAKEVQVQYTGIVPSLFREGQGVVVEGQFNKQGVFQANQVLAKHDEKYMPPGIKPNKR